MSSASSSYRSRDHPPYPSSASWVSSELEKLLPEVDRRVLDKSLVARPASTTTLLLANGTSNSSSAPPESWLVKRPLTPADSPAKRNKHHQQSRWEADSRTPESSQCDESDGGDDSSESEDGDDDDRDEKTDSPDGSDDQEPEDDEDPSNGEDSGVSEDSEDGQDSPDSVDNQDDYSSPPSSFSQPSSSSPRLYSATAPKQLDHIQTHPLRNPPNQHYAPSQLARSKMAARPSAADDVSLFKQIEADYKARMLSGALSPAGASPPPSQQHIQDATRRSREQLQKSNARRERDQARARQSSNSNICKRVKSGKPSPTSTAEQTRKHKLPIDSTRTVVQYTVFETQQLPLPFDGQLRDKVLRRQTFLDKHKANRHAARLMPKAEYANHSSSFSSSSAIARIECDFGIYDADPERGGMFLGRVYYANHHIKFVYVDRELQQLGTLSVTDLEKEVGGRDLAPAYVSAFLAVRYDVFVVLKRDIQPDDGRIVIYAYDEDTPDTEDSQDPPVLGSHFQHVLEGSYTTLADANIKAIDAFEKWTQPPADRPRLDALIYHRDYLKPDIAERRKRFAEVRQGGAEADANQENADANRRDVESVELSWEPPPDFGYGYSMISVVVTKSQMEGPLDLTGAFA